MFTSTELPTITGSTVGYSTYTGTTGAVDNTFFVDNSHRQYLAQQSALSNFLGNAGWQPANANAKEAKLSQKRIVQVFVCDPDDNIPLDKALLYKGDPKFTDSTDQELFFEIDIKTILDAHNEFRTTLTKKNSEKKLDAIRVRDLKMVVVNVAQF